MLYLLLTLRERSIITKRYNLMKNGKNIAPLCLCGTNKYKAVYRGIWDKEKWVFDFSIFSCVRCGMMRVIPIPFRSTGGTFDIQTRKRCVNLWKSFSEKLITLIIADKNKKNAKLNLIDIGSSIGILVRMAKDLGWKAVGIDLDKNAVEVGKKKFGIDLRHTSLEKAGFKKGEFDVVVMSHVLEHILDPDSVLTEALRVLKKDGLLVVQVPNIEGLPVKVQNWRGDVWYGYWPTQHIWHFTPKTLRMILEKNGFKIVKVDTRHCMYYEPTGHWTDVPRDLILKLSNLLGMADQTTIVATPGKLR